MRSIFFFFLKNAVLEKPEWEIITSVKRPPIGCQREFSQSLCCSPRVFYSKWSDVSAKDYANQENESSSFSLVLTYDEPLLSGTTYKRPIFGYEEKKKKNRFEWRFQLQESTSSTLGKVPPANGESKRTVSARLNNKNHCCPDHFFKPILVKICIQYLFYSVLTGFT